MHISACRARPLPTIALFLSGCAINMVPCEDEVRRTLLEKLEKKNSPGIFITQAHFHTSVIDCLRITEIHKTETELGIYAAHQSVDLCQ